MTATGRSVTAADQSAQHFREAMTRLGAAVNVITSDGPAGRLGFTASAVCSVSDSPPTLLVCMNRSSAQNEPIKTNGVMCVNSLSAGQGEVSKLFAGIGKVAMADRFDRTGWSTLLTDSPVLADTVVSFDCRISATIEVATHTILVGEVAAIQFGDSAGGLMYFGRNYHDLPLPR
jgi:flavin reductase